MSNREQMKCSSRSNECPAGIYTEGILLDAPELTKDTALCGVFC